MASLAPTLHRGRDGQRVHASGTPGFLVRRGSLPPGPKGKFSRLTARCFSRAWCRDATRLDPRIIGEINALFGPAAEHLAALGTAPLPQPLWEMEMPE